MHRSSHNASDSQYTLGPYAQSASMISGNFRHTLDPDVAAVDSFYAMTELFQWSASSTCQQINLIETIIDQNTGYNLQKSQEFSLANLAYHHDILNRLEARLREAISQLEQHQNPMWPKLYRPHDAFSLEAMEIAKKAAELLLRDFKTLLSRTEWLSARCQGGMTVCMNSAAIAESKRAISQAEQVEQLTRLAFFYIPISFTTSFFGMNLVIFGTGTIPLWTWFAASIPLALASYLVLALLSRRRFSL
jgi:Mg2+ and Co2+ transporter CorA